MHPCRKFFGLLLALLSLQSCSSYQAKPLDTKVRFATLDEFNPNDQTLKKFAVTWPLTSRAHIFDPADGLDVDELAMLAIANNPQLKVARDQAGEVYAQAFSAGLLPDPQLGFSQDYPKNQPDATVAYSAGISLDISSFILRSSKREAARQSTRGANLDLLWQEWQIANQARVLFVRTIALEKQSQILKNQVTLLETRYQHAKNAFENGNLTINATSADLAALHTATQKLNDTQRQLLTTRYAMNALVGLAPEHALKLTGTVEISIPDEQQIETELNQLAQRRPDLLALQYGYSSQESKLQTAVLSQFQPLGLGFNLARDTSALLTNGFALSLALPIFNRNQGGIAIEVATRQRLFDEFNQRLNTAYSEVHQLLADGRLLQEQLKQIQTGLTDTLNVSQKAQAAFDAHNMDELAYVQILNTTTDKRIQENILQETLMEQQIALQILLGGDLPIDKYSEPVWKMQ